MPILRGENNYACLFLTLLLFEMTTWSSKPCLWQIQLTVKLCNVLLSVRISPGICIHVWTNVIWYNFFHWVRPSSPSLASSPTPDPLAQQRTPPPPLPPWAPSRSPPGRHRRSPNGWWERAAIKDNRQATPPSDPDLLIELYNCIQLLESKSALKGDPIDPLHLTVPEEMEVENMEGGICWAERSLEKNVDKMKKICAFEEAV